MIQAILFDLDGTLLPGDLDTQLSVYLGRLAAYARVHIPELADTLLRDVPETCVEVVYDTDPGATVFDKFWSRYCKKTGADVKRVEPLFERFYQTDYGLVGGLYTPVPEILEAVRLVIARGLKTVVATNSLYPLAAVEWRLKWAGLNPNDFDAVTHYQNMRHTKPHLAYFREAAGLVGVAPENCCMVGNNGKEDMVAAKLSMKTFLLDDFAIDCEGYAGPRGGYADLIAWLSII